MPLESSKTLAAIALCLTTFGCAGTVPGTARTRPADDEERGSAVADALLDADVALALLTKLGSDSLGIDVAVSGGRVFLSGEVDERATQELAEEVALSVHGVASVENRIALAAPATTATPVAGAVGTAEREVSDAALELKVGKNLLAEIGRYALDVEVEVTDGVASLRGTLPDRERRRLALRAAERTSGVTKVIDLLRTDGR